MQPCHTDAHKSSVWGNALNTGRNYLSDGQYPRMVHDWYYDRGAYNEIFTTPSFDGEHGSEEYGEVGWWTTHEEMMSFLEDLPNNQGNIEKTLKWPFLVFSKPSVFPQPLENLLYGWKGKSMVMKMLLVKLC